MTLTRAVLGLSLTAFLVSCSNQPPPAHSIGEAYVGPTTLNLRQELALKSAVAATVKHGDKLAIVEYRHRLVRVRTEQGAEGWTDTRQLLSPQQMDGLRAMAESAAHAPSQGVVTVFETLNLHTEPSRTSPSFAQLPENGKADVIDHKLTPRIQAAGPALLLPVKPPPVRKKGKPKSAPTRIAAPPKPAPPKLPSNWVALSVPKAEPVAPVAPPTPAAPPVEVPMDDWNLVRTHEGKVGWALTRPLSMAIPDEVAQYAEGHRITSYFPLGQVHDGGAVKNNWLWTTITKGGKPYEFDSFRVFVWSLKHHRYSARGSDVAHERRLARAREIIDALIWEWDSPFALTDYPEAGPAVEGLVRHLGLHPPGLAGFLTVFDLRRVLATSEGLEACGFDADRLGRVLAACSAWIEDGTWLAQIDAARGSDVAHERRLAEEAATRLGIA